MKKMRDSQRSAMYAWERKFRDDVYKELPDCSEMLPLGVCEDLVREVWADYRPKEAIPTVVDGRGRRYAGGSRRKISLPRWARSRVVVLHETAHSLMPTDEPPHGKMFARLFLELLDHYTKLPIRELKKMAVAQRPRRVHFALAAACPKPISRELQAWRKCEAELVQELYDHQMRKPKG